MYTVPPIGITHASQETFETSETITYTVPESTAIACAASIKEEVGEVKGVESVEELRSRYARGEIDQEEFDRRKRDLA